MTPIGAVVSEMMKGTTRKAECSSIEGANKLLDGNVSLGEPSVREDDLEDMW
jgi:hypothetical protein